MKDHRRGASPSSRRRRLKVDPQARMVGLATANRRLMTDMLAARIEIRSKQCPARREASAGSRMPEGR